MIPWVHPSPQPKRHLDWFTSELHDISLRVNCGRGAIVL